MEKNPRGAPNERLVGEGGRGGVETVGEGWLGDGWYVARGVGRG